MTHENDQAKQEFVDSLLQALYETDKHQSRALVSSGMHRLDHVSLQASEKLEAKQVHHAKRQLAPKWLTIGLATAALILIAISIPMFGNSKTAMAAVTLSLNQAMQDIGRHYVVTSSWSLPQGRKANYKIDLYVKGGEQFALSIPGPLQQMPTVWIGSNRKHSWVVPPIGPVLKGNRNHLNDWFDQQKDVTTPYLHITTALEKMSELYDLKILTDEDIVNNGVTFRCRRVRGKLRGIAGNRTPDQIDLWADAKTGVAMKIVANWNFAQDKLGRESVTIVLQEETELEDKFFTPEDHGGQGRKQISFASEN